MITPAATASRSPLEPTPHGIVRYRCDSAALAHKGSDADAAWFWEPLKFNAMVRSHQPKAVINPRSGWEGVFKLVLPGLGQRIASFSLLSAGDVACVQTPSQIELSLSNQPDDGFPAVVELVLDAPSK